MQRWKDQIDNQLTDLPAERRPGSPVESSSRVIEEAPDLGSPSPPPPPPARWAPDPLGRHEFRYWDGARWTEHVSDGGSQALDFL
ncbi:MAG: DUF2510 domain-containing protein [Actinobacteria bacterium]|nr:DUF2510 domain-containing protein [Actinomycetota bacterium]